MIDSTELCASSRRVIEAARLPTLSSLIAEIQRGGIYPWIIADLSLGAWRGRMLATELLPQLGGSVDDMSADSFFERFGKDIRSYADIISLSIDNETRGREFGQNHVELAKAIASGVGASDVRTVVVLAPRFGLLWDHADLALMRVLTNLLPAKVRLLVAIGDNTASIESIAPVCWINGCNEPSGAGSDALIALVPGIIKKAVADVLVPNAPEVALVSLMGECQLVPPECRRDPRAISVLRFDTLHASAHAIGQRWLEAYAQYRGNNLFVEPHLLAAEAWHLFGEGNTELALRLTERAYECVEFEERHVLEVELQGMRIGLGEYNSAACMPDPSRAYPADARGFLFKAKGWALTMGGEPSKASPYFELARAAMDRETEPREYLYLLNVHALAKLKCRDIDGAVVLEQEIEQRLAELKHPDWVLTYINRLNLARLHRRRGELDQSRQYYIDAFATRRGVESEYDAVQSNFSIARIDEMRQNWTEALIGYLRASLYWLSMTNSEGLPLRTTMAILGRSLREGECLVEAVSVALSSRIEAMSNKSGIPNAEFECQPCTFIRMADRRNVQWSVAGPGWTVFGDSGWDRGHDKGAGHDLLGRQVRGALVALSLVDELRWAKCLAVDNDLGEGMQSDPLSVIDACVRFGIVRVWLGGEWFALEKRDQIEAQSRVRLGSGVDHLEQENNRMQVVFKRYLRPTALSIEDARLVEGVNGDPTLLDLADRLHNAGPLGSIIRRVRELENKRVLKVHTTEEACLAAGIRLPSRANLTAM